MRNTRIGIAALAAVWLLSACDGSNGANGQDLAVRTFGSIAFEPCTLSSPMAPSSIDAQCAKFEVAENPAQPKGRKIPLNIAWLPARDQAGGTSDPVFFLAGGPGQAATEYAAQVDMALRDVRKQRDIVLIDQRGTGKLSPLQCRDAQGKDLALQETDEANADAISGFAGRCAQALAGKADPRFYTTTEAIGDLDQVRRALGVQKINLVGVSYGTRVAQQYAARFPEHTRAIVLDGVAPNTLVVGGEFARTFERALGLQVAQCRQLASCRDRFPQDLRTQLRTLKDRLQKAPVEVEYRDPSSAEIRRDTLTADTVVGLTHMFSYMPQMASLLPVVIDEADRGRYAPLMALAQMMTREMGGQMNRGMQWSVICAEDADRYRPDPDDAGTVLGGDMANAFFAACQQWPHGTRPAAFSEPLRSKVPALLMSGEIDPVTPPAYAEAVLKGLPNGRHLVLRGQGHNVGGTGCMPKLVGQFLETTDARKLDAQCLDAIGYVPPFTGFNGWEP
ncbi:alpha/beta hydrolase [Lysobacter niastensis]|uniref:Alpha/beta hydrolase n=1 Tax=Lysobacter niastensis TaxID=380629 RepID=A0ABS0B409_9GAMM|nr:alpha/beta hydrolase [Lysobacter niastensis]MBF6023248.1 alpha/beta hydrolase [Lysobacter niastensis]